MLNQNVSESGIAEQAGKCTFLSAKNLISSVKKVKRLQKDDKKSTKGRLVFYKKIH